MADGLRLDKPPIQPAETSGLDIERGEAAIKADALEILEKVGPEEVLTLGDVIRKNWLYLTTLPAVSAILVYNHYDTDTNIFGEEIPNIQNAIVGGGIIGLAVASIVLAFALMAELPKSSRD